MTLLADRLLVMEKLLDGWHPDLQNRYFYDLRQHRIRRIGAPTGIWDIVFPPWVVAMGGMPPPAAIFLDGGDRRTIERLIAVGHPVGALCWATAVLDADPMSIPDGVWLPPPGEWTGAIAAVAMHAPPDPDDLPDWCVARLADRLEDLRPLTVAHPAWTERMLDRIVLADADLALRWAAAAAA